ncbi:MAG TPA: hypothetical protein VNS58_17110 [Puia sp.]|nr:hypothetical protein [Puia sp.]
MPFIIFFAGLALGMLAPFWWSIMPVSFITAWFFAHSRSKFFWSAFLANALLWLLFIMWWSVPNSFLLANKVSRIYRIPHWSILGLAVVLLGGLLSGLSALCGVLARKMIDRFKAARRRDAA